MTVFDILNLKIPLILSISILMSKSNFILSLVEHDKSFITLEPDHVRYQFKLHSSLDVEIKI